MMNIAKLNFSINCFKDESLRTGCIYAIGLFFSSLISALINIHFTISMNKLIFKIKTVVIHTIYYKVIINY